MSALGWIILALCVIAVAVLFVVFVHRLAQRGGGSMALRRRFGPEYDRAVEQSGDREAAERKLAEIARRRETLDVRPLNETERADYNARWDELQTKFVDDPAAATRQADQLIAEVMRTRGYRATSFDERAELLSADRPAVVQPYRQAHAEASSQPAGEGTEHLRSAFVHYREPFAWLVDGGRPKADTEQAAQTAPADVDDADESAALIGPDRRPV